MTRISFFFSTHIGASSPRLPFIDTATNSLLIFIKVISFEDACVYSRSEVTLVFVVGNRIAT